jgi:PAS domain S-box-containing protein
LSAIGILVNEYAAPADPAKLASFNRLPWQFGYILLSGAVLFVVLRRLDLQFHQSGDTFPDHDARIRALVEGYPVPMWLHNGADAPRILAVNEAALLRWGYTREEFLALDPMDLRPSEEQPRFRERLRAVEAHAGLGFVDAGLWKYRTKAGEEFFAHVTTNTVAYAGAPAKMVLALDAGAELKAMDIVLRHEALLTQLHESLSDGLWAGNADGTEILHVSPALERIYGCQAQDIKRDPMYWLKAVVEEDVDAVREASKDLLSKRSIELEYRIRRKDGQIRWVRDCKTVIYDAAGTVIRVGGVLQDVTAVHAAKAQLAAQNESLERRVAERTAQLAAAYDALQSFSYMAAHDLKAPLRVISGFTALALTDIKGHVEPESLAMLERVQKSASSLGELIDDLLALSKVGMAELERTPLNLTGMSEAILRDLQEREPDRHVTVVVHEGLQAQADGGLTASLLSNLIGNAWKYSGKRETATIEIGARPNAMGEIVFFVKDNGAGFPMEHAVTMFEPFKRLHSTSEFTGTGIGLAICKRIVSRHHGIIWAESEPDVGSTFYFNLQPSLAGAALAETSQSVLAKQ